MEPTICFTPFGSDTPRIALFGKQTGNWNPSCFQDGATWQSNPGLYSRFNSIAGRYRFSEILIPSPNGCSTLICDKKGFSTEINNGIGSVRVKRGAQVDGVILARATGAIASADCPTIVVYCPVIRHVIFAHAGSKSLIDIDHVLHGQSARPNKSVVDEIMKVAKNYSFYKVKVFITCGISGPCYHFPELVHSVRTTFGHACVAGDGIDLKKIIAQQFFQYGVMDVLTDNINTYADKDGKGEFLWHSYRRGKTEEEKRGRNLVLVMNE